MSDYKKYLPSKKFASIIISIIVIIALFFATKWIISIIKERKISKDSPTPMTVGSLIQKDSNKNGIADWEEYLWGLNPEKNGQENKDFIMAKKKPYLIRVKFCLLMTQKQPLKMRFFQCNSLQLLCRYNKQEI